MCCMRPTLAWSQLSENAGWPASKHKEEKSANSIAAATSRTIHAPMEISVVGRRVETLKRSTYTKQGAASETKKESFVSRPENCLVALNGSAGGGGT